MKKLNKKGFTLIELIVVIGILAVLALILIPSITNYLAEAREARDNANARALYSEIQAAVAFGETPVSPATGGGLSCPFTITDGVLTAFGPCTGGSATITFTP